MSQTQKLKRLAAGSLRFKTLNDNLYIVDFASANLGEISDIIKP